MDDRVSDVIAVAHDDDCACGWCRLRAGGARGGAAAGAARRERRARYLAGTMTTRELQEYRRVLDNARRAGKLGGSRRVTSEGEPR